MISRADFDKMLVNVLGINALPKYVTRYDENYRIIKLSPQFKKEYDKVREVFNQAIIDKGFYAQRGEDIVIKHMFDTLGINDGCCMEFGARDGVVGSNTFWFCKNWGFKGLMVEGDPKYYPELLETAKAHPNIIPEKLYIDCKDNTIDSVLAKHDFPVDLDLLSIDIDSNDYWVWKSVVQFRPKVVVIEFNPNYKESLTIEYQENLRWRQTSYYGATAPALYKLGQEKGYDLIYNAPYNLIFIDSKIDHPFEKLDIAKVNYYFRKDMRDKRQMIPV